MKAESFLQESENVYLKYKILYNIALVNAYLGYSEKAEKQYTECLSGFEKGIKAATGPNSEFNNQRYFLYTVHRLINLYQQNGEYEKSAELLQTAKAESGEKDHRYEQLLLKKSEGVQKFYRQDYRESVSELSALIPDFVKEDDFDWTAVCYFYMAKSYWSLGDQDQAVKNFKSIDSIFVAREYFNPELRETYELLLEYYKNENDQKGQLFAIDRLIEANRYREKELGGLNLALQNKMEQQTKILNHEKQKLEKSSGRLTGWVMLLAGLGIILILGVYILLNHNRKTNQKLRELLARPSVESVTLELKKEQAGANAGMTDGTSRKLLQLLENFERENGYTQQALTLSKLAEEFETNTHYLSEIINQYLGKSFNEYLNELRINHLIDNLISLSIERNIKLDVLALKYGYANRQGLNRIFKEYTGMTVKTFIDKLNRNELRSVRKPVSVLPD